MMFTNDEDLDRADWPLLQSGAVNLFWRSEVLEDSRNALRLLGYGFAEVSCDSGWSDFESQMSSVLQWKEQFGYAPWTGNLNAFNDGLRGYPFDPSGRNALVIRSFDRLVAEDAAGSRGLLDVLETGARDHLLRGKMLVVLIQTNDNQYDSGPIGARSAQWNSREWFTANRGL